VTNLDALRTSNAGIEAKAGTGGGAGEQRRE
jgi:hypothetical protein